MMTKKKTKKGMARHAPMPESWAGQKKNQRHKSETETPMARLPAEVEQGNVEYKYQLVHGNNHERILKLTSQLKWRVAEGGGTAFYQLGVEDDGSRTGICMKDMRLSLQTLREMARSLDCKIANVEYSKGILPDTKVAKVTVQRKPAVSIPAETRVVVLGESGSGTSSLIGVLKTNEADDGNGLARLHVLQHQHELEKGLTSTVSLHQVYFNREGQAVHTEPGEVTTELYTGVDNSDECPDIQNWSKIVNLIDVPGHGRFVKSIVYGATALEPDFAFITVEGEMLLKLVMDGENTLALTINMISFCHALEIPIAIVVSKVDLIPKESYCEFPRAVDILLRKANYPAEDSAIRILPCSNVTKFGLDEITKFLYEAVNPLKRNERDGIDGVVSMYNREAFYILGFDGAIVGGILQSGSIELGDQLHLGPNEHGAYYTVSIQSIRTFYGLSVSKVTAGHTATFGVCLVSSDENDDFDNDTYSSQADFFRSVVRRGSCLLSPTAFHETTQTVQLGQVKWLNFDKENAHVLCEDEVNIELAIKGRRFVLRAHTVKLNVTIQKLSVESYEIGATGQQPERLPVGTTVTLQAGQMIGVAKVISHS